MTAIRAYVALGVIAALLALAGWWHLSRVQAAERAVHAHYAAVLADIGEKTAQAATEFRAIEQAWQTAFDKEARDGREKIAAARADADAARAAGDSLRAALDRRRAAARATEGAIAAQRRAGELGEGTVDMLADLLGRHTRELESVGAFADELRARGLACERAADALTAPTPPALPASAPTGAPASPRG